MESTMKAIQLTHLENELMDIRREIRKLEGVINSPKVSGKFKKKAKNMIPVLAKRRDELISEITEAALLEETESNLA